jgi:hypothetical protein
MIDVNSLTLGEVAKVEELSNLPITKFSTEDAPKGLALAALAFIWKKRTDPKFSWNAAQALTMEQANEILGVGEVVDEESEEGKEEISSTSKPKNSRRS